MKNYSSILAVALIGATGVWVSAANPYKVKQEIQEPRRLKVMPSEAKNEGNNKVWKPGTAIRSNYNGMSWKEYAKYTFTYDSEGRTITELAENMDKTQTQYYPYSLTINRYDAKGRLCSKSVSAGYSEDELEPYTEMEIKYDDIREDVVVEQNAYNVYEDGTKELNPDSYKQIIERDEEGHIIRMNAFTLYNGNFLEVLAVEIKYGSDGKPTEIIESALAESEDGVLELQLAEMYSECKWVESNGQIVTLDDITGRGNKLASANVNTPSQADIRMSVEYPENGDFDFISTSEYEYLSFLPTKTVMSHKDFGPTGYYTKTVTDQDLTAAGAYPVQSIDQILCQYDEYGNLLEMQDQTFYGHTIINSWEKGYVQTDPTTGLPSSYLRQKYRLQEGSDYYGSWEDSYRIDYGEWHEVSGSPEICEDARTGITEYYDLQGCRVVHPDTGVYIRHRGAKVDKIIIR